MNHAPVPLIFSFLAALAVQAGEFKIGKHTFTLPDGFTIELVTDTNLVQRPVSAGFDDQGRLYVTDSSGSNDKPDLQLKNPNHRVLRLEDSDGNGRFDKSVVFADKVMFPQGCLWHNGSVYVAGPPSIWKFTDTDGDGVADKREEWFKGGTLTGCANDIHGPYLGPDGYLYWTKGAFAEQTHTLGNGRILKDKAAHIYRARPDGSDLDVIMSGGMDNPVEVAFTPEGEAIFTSTFIDFSQPGFRDGLAHAVYGGVFGKENDVIEDGRVKRTGPELVHPFYQAGPAAECALARYESDGFGPSYRDNFFATGFNLHKVTRHVLQASGATYSSTNSDFVVSDNTDFHPTDVLPDADGTLLIVDTGGWYKLCCPSSQLVKTDVLGGIYRVKKTGMPNQAPDKRGEGYRKLVNPPTMAGYALPAILKRAVWNNDSSNKSWFRELLAKHSTGAATSSESAQIVRVAAEGLGHLRDKTAIPMLLAAIAVTGDRDGLLCRSLTFALIEIGAGAETRTGLSYADPEARRAALIALDQMDGSDLKPSEVVQFLNASDERLRTAANWILSHHPEWGGELAGWLREQLSERGSASRSGFATTAKEEAAAAHRAALHQHFRLLTRSTAGQQFLADAVTQPGFADDTRLAALNAMADARTKDVPAIWKEAVLAALKVGQASSLPRTGETPVLLSPAIRAARNFNTDLAVQAALLEIAQDEKLILGATGSSNIRLDALAALPSGTTLSPSAFAHVRRAATVDDAPATRATAASLLSRAKLTAEQLSALTENIPNASPLALGPILPAFAAGGDEALGQKLLAALRESKSAKALPPGQIKPTFVKFPESVRQAADEFLATLDSDSAKQSQRLDTLLAEFKELPKEIVRGQAVFNSAKAACMNCHKIGYVGGNLGPDLTRVGQVRTEHDLLEAIVYPSASFVRSYEPMAVATKSGEDYSGVLRKDAADEIVLGTGPQTEMRIARADITQMRPGLVSIMPAGLDQQLTKQELADLLAFLKNTK